MNVKINFRPTPATSRTSGGEAQRVFPNKLCFPMVFPGVRRCCGRGDLESSYALEQHLGAWMEDLQGKYFQHRKRSGR